MKTEAMCKIIMEAVGVDRAEAVRTINSLCTRPSEEKLIGLKELAKQKPIYANRKARRDLKFIRGDKNAKTK